MRKLSKSKIIAYRQCPKRLWLEVHRPELKDDSGSEAVFAIGNQVGEIAQTIYNPNQDGYLIEVDQLGWEVAYQKSEDWLANANAPLFEAALKIPGGLALADVMLPDSSNGQKGWRMIEVKSSTSVKDYHHDDIAVQTYIAEQSGIPLTSVALAHVDNSFVYPGGGDYVGLLTEVDLTAEAKGRSEEVAGWFNEAHTIIEQTQEPNIEPGPQCNSPFTCSFCHHCIPEEEHREYPLTSFYRMKASRREELESQGCRDIRDVPANALTGVNQRIREHSITGEAYFEQEGAAAALAQFSGEPRFLDFETISFAVPIWAGTRPYTQLPFQFSLHHLDEKKALRHHDFLELSGDDPREQFAQDLIQHCGESGPIFAYNAPFERRVIWALADNFPRYKKALIAIHDRIEDLLPIARNFYYHPCQHGSWSLKAVLPAICPDLSYSELDGVQDGHLAQQAYLEASSPETTPERREQIKEQLLKYCELDTFALVRMWQFFSGRPQT